jgi:hypothetical protein
VEAKTRKPDPARQPLRRLPQPALPKAKSPKRPAADAQRSISMTATLPSSFQAESLAIPGGWLPGRYAIQFRLNHAADPGSRDSCISTPVEFLILAP